MDRRQALAAAQKLATARGWGPTDGVRQAAMFGLDSEEQTFVELEGGGPDRFKQLIREGSYSPYRWEVRRFAPDELRETLIRFTPGGAPYGFGENIPEASPGPVLARDSALVLARTEALRWQVDLAGFDLAESAQVARSSGRVDHTFTWERRAAALGEGKLRLRIVISGDRPSELTHFIQIPEAFTRRYASIRSSNDAIAGGAFGAMLLVYGVLGLGVGLFTMLRRGLVLWRPPLIAGLVVGGLQAASFVNALPLSWMSYDTAVPVRTHLLQQGGMLVLLTLISTLQIAVTAAAAETLTRAAFPSHPQFWRLWSREAGASTAILGRTALGLLFIGLDLAYVVWFSKATRDGLGWWNPSDLLAQPNLFATWLPWLSPVTDALQAGFWEECLFRAIPLAGAALLGQRFGRRGLWIAAAMVVQALVFAAGHANYPAQPAYARVVELILPSLVFGFVYLRFGLLTGILMHFGYDLALMAMPVFVAKSPGIWWSRGMVLAAGFAPLGIVLLRRAQAGRWLTLPDVLRNGAWRAAGHPTVPPSDRPMLRPSDRPFPRWLPLAGSLGFLLWLLAGTWSAPEPRLAATRAEAVRLARDTLAARGILLGAEWRALPSLHAERELAHTFVWRTAGDSMYRRLLGAALPVAHWDVRFAKFTGDVVERAEEWTVAVQGHGQVTRISHDLPESRPGDTLSEADAHRMADSAARAGLRLAPAHLRSVSIAPSRRVARTDWDVTYADTALTLPLGEVRTGVTIAGSEVTDVSRFVHVPESWQREWDRTTSVRSLAPLGGGLVLILALIATLVMAVTRWAGHRFDVRSATRLARGILPLTLLGALNAWPESVAHFRTAEPWGLQVTFAVAGGLVLQTVMVAVASLVVGAALPPGGISWRTLPKGLALGLVLLGVEAAAGALGRAPPFHVPDFLQGLVPGAAVVVGVTMGFLGRAGLVLVVVFIGSHLAGRRLLEGGWYLLAGGIATVLSAREGMVAIAAAWALGGVGFWMASRVARSNGGSLLVATLTWAGLGALQDAWVGDAPIAAVGGLLGVFLLALAARSIRPSVPALAADA